MEAKKLGLVLGISTIVVAFTMILHLLEAPQVQHPSPLLLNLTSCHESMRRSDLPVYCSDLPGTLELPPHNTLNKIKILDVLSITKLRCSYEKVNFPWLNNRPRPSVPLEVARNVLKTRQNAKLQRNGRFLDSTLRARVNRPKVRRTKKEKDEEEEILVVHGIDVPEERYVKFDVYVNVVNETIMYPRFREFAGTFVHIDPGMIRVAREANLETLRKKTDLKLGISELLEDLEADGDDSIWVT
ncbi:AUREUSIDIN SYNTHASE-LIKE [Salix koriyanagi]|uniref:AUREUSIDIN SYNTHASE-LIKE n=1 Tax=Salix koriyanagi TaxID=2511006 RepID=A0A9Q0ZLR0_9ROSI|nr:AUREUSIDIN SYNTHASE-LIKE [Salix koriyanagi]